MAEMTERPSAKVATGVPGLDEVLYGGVPGSRLYLVQGDPGAGKTTLGLQFLMEGARRGERGLYVTLSETEEELRAVAGSHGWSLEGITLHELSRMEDRLAAEEQNTFFRPSEVELNETTRPVLEIIETAKPTRVVFDSLSEMRLLAGDPLRYRRQVLALKQFFIGRKCTVLFMDDRTSAAGDLQLQSLAHGVINLEQLAPEYGGQRRRLRIVKMRGAQFRGGYHDFVIETGGIRVFPRLAAAEHQREFPSASIASGIAELDQLLGGGLDRGSSNLFTGPAGVGKSTLAAQYALAAADRGEKACVFIFDEDIRTFLGRAESLRLNARKHLDAGTLVLRRINPAELSPGEFAHMVQTAVEREDARVIVIDSLNGFLNAMSGERAMVLQLHELLAYLGRQGVVTILVVAQYGLVGAVETPIDASYLADTVVLLRYFEHGGQVRQAISVVKKRQGRHERTIREIRIGEGGLQVGEPLTEFDGVLTGMPAYHGKRGPLMADGDDRRSGEQA